MGFGTDPTEYGADCLCCWPPGETPLVAYISFGGLEGCHPDDPFFPQPVNDNVEVVQKPGDPCYFESSVGTYQYIWAACLGDKNACYQNDGAWATFKAFVDGNCQASFENELLCGQPFVAAEAGNAAVMFNISHTDGSLGSLMHAINMEPDAETKFEFWPASEERIVVRFARKKDATNILIMVEPTEL